MSHPSPGRGQHRGTRIPTPPLPPPLPPRPTTRASPRRRGRQGAGGRLRGATQAPLYGRGGRGAQSSPAGPRAKFRADRVFPAGAWPQPGGSPQPPSFPFPDAGRRGAGGWAPSGSLSDPGDPPRPLASGQPMPGVRRRPMVAASWPALGEAGTGRGGAAWARPGSGV